MTTIPFSPKGQEHLTPSGSRQSFGSQDKSQDEPPLLNRRGLLSTSLDMGVTAARRPTGIPSSYSTPRPQNSPRRVSHLRADSSPSLWRGIDPIGGQAMSRSASNPASMHDILTPTSSTFLGVPAQPILGSGIPQRLQQPDQRIRGIQVDHSSSGTAIPPANPGLPAQSAAIRLMSSTQSSTDTSKMPETPEEFLQIRSHPSGT